MDPFWRSTTGKLLMGGCGTQVGMGLALAGLTIALLFCAACTLVNLLSVNVTRQAAVSTASAPAGMTGQQLEVLQVLSERVRTLRANVPAPVTATPLPPPPRPIAVAIDSAANLRSGPGEQYNQIGRLPAGDHLEIAGRNADSTWWLVATPEGAFAWVSGMVVTTFNTTDAIPVVTIPALLVQPAAGLDPAPANANTAAAAGTPIPAAETSRRFVQDTTGYKQLVRRFLLPTVSESFAPDGQRIAVTERIKLYTITTDGATSRVLIEKDPVLTLVGGTVWSPDGAYLALVVDRLEDCDPCRTVALVRLGDGAVTLLEPPPVSALTNPRWTQDGRLLVLAYLTDPAQGRTYLYQTSGQGEPATGHYELSSSHAGQKWFPWQPGRTWSVENTPPDSYYSD